MAGFPGDNLAPGLTAGLTRHKTVEMCSPVENSSPDMLTFSIYKPHRPRIASETPANFLYVANSRAVTMRYSVSLGDHSLVSIPAAPTTVDSLIMYDLRPYYTPFDSSWDALGHTHSKLDNFAFKIPVSRQLKSYFLPQSPKSAKSHLYIA